MLRSCHPEDYLSQTLGWFSPTISVGLWMLSHFGAIAAVAGGLLGGGGAAAIVGLRRIANGSETASECAHVRRRDRVLAVIMWGAGGVLLTLACALGTFAAFASVIDSDTAHRIVSRRGEIDWLMWIDAGQTVAMTFAAGGDSNRASSF